jgi:hypothetical protein
VKGDRVPPQSRGLHCVACGFEDLRVVDSRPSVNSVRRRRRCARCRHTSTTYEIQSPTGDDASRLVDALTLHDRVCRLPQIERTAVLSLLRALSGRELPAIPGLLDLPVMLTAGPIKP